MPDSPTPLAAPIHVLIADDHAAVREGVRAVLSVESGIDVVGEAIDGPSALRLVRELAPDLVVLDNSMPGLSGLDVSRRLAWSAARSESLAAPRRALTTILVAVQIPISRAAPDSACAGTAIKDAP